ncbi:hypothetical protein MAR_007304 [Mya arenaria]|uniref:Uncharacterized protein n=1 Tax=Mya arenaria TaxID=6604 RepID=A0ABY7DC26_MYAAR|nr:hypothetical protein MAR_007304 [Mya arenaria]
MEDGSQQKYHVVRPDHLTADAPDCYLREEWRLAFGDFLVIGICFPSDGYYSIEVTQPYQLDMDALVSVGSRDELEKSDSYDGKKFYFDSTTKIGVQVPLGHLWTGWPSVVDGEIGVFGPSAPELVEQAEVSTGAVTTHIRRMAECLAKTISSRGKTAIRMRAHKIENVLTRIMCLKF